MSHDDDHDQTIDRADERKPDDDAGTAFAAAIAASLSKLLALLAGFRRTADQVAETANRDIRFAYLRARELAAKAQEAAIRNRYPRAMLDWNALEARARYHGIAFSVTAQAHHRAAVLDYLDNPDAPTLISGKHLSWLAPVNVHAVDPARHAANWDRYFALCKPLQNRDIDHDHAMRATLMALRHLQPKAAAQTAAAIPQPPPARTYQRPGVPTFG